MNNYLELVELWEVNFIQPLLNTAAVKSSLAGLPLGSRTGHGNGYMYDSGIRDVSLLISILSSV